MILKLSHKIIYLGGVLVDDSDYLSRKIIKLKKGAKAVLSDPSFLSFLQPSQKGGRGSLMSKRWQSVSVVIISFWWQRQELVEKNISATKDD